MYITVMCQKGEQAKTATSVNLAAALALTGLTGVVVDLDKQQGDSLKFSGTLEGVEWTDVLPDKTPDGGFVVVDTHPIVSHDTINALIRSDMVLIPCTPLSPSLEALARTFETIELARQKKDSLGAIVVFTRVEKKQYSEGMIAAARIFSQWPVCDTIIPSRPMDFERAWNAKIPLTCHLPKSAASVAYRALASEIKKIFSTSK